MLIYEGRYLYFFFFLGKQARVISNPFVVNEEAINQLREYIAYDTWLFTSS